MFNILLVSPTFNNSNLTTNNIDHFIIAFHIDTVKMRSKLKLNSNFNPETESELEPEVELEPVPLLKLVTSLS